MGTVYQGNEYGLLSDSPILSSKRRQTRYKLRLVFLAGCERIAPLTFFLCFDLLLVCSSAQKLNRSTTSVCYCERKQKIKTWGRGQPSELHEVDLQR